MNKKRFESLFWHDYTDENIKKYSHDIKVKKEREDTIGI